MDQSAYFEQIRRKRREEILAAARAMILAHGIDTFNIQQLARKLDISTVTLYKYFKNSDDIMSALQKEIIGQWKPLYQDFSSAGNALDDFLLYLEDFFMDALEHQEDLSLLLLFQVHSREQEGYGALEQLTQPYAEELHAFLAGLLVRAEEEGHLKPDLDPDTALRFICGLNFAMIQRVSLLSRQNFRKQKKALLEDIRQLIGLYRLYLTGTSDLDINYRCEKSPIGNKTRKGINRNDKDF